MDMILQTPDDALAVVSQFPPEWVVANYCYARNDKNRNQMCLDFSQKYSVSAAKVFHRTPISAPAKKHEVIEKGDGFWRKSYSYRT